MECERNEMGFSFDEVLVYLYCIDLIYIELFLNICNKSCMFFKYLLCGIMFL